MLFLDYLESKCFMAAHPPMGLCAQILAKTVLPVKGCVCMSLLDAALGQIAVVYVGRPMIEANRAFLS
jgi:hypothetical protein